MTTSEHGDGPEDEVEVRGESRQLRGLRALERMSLTPMTASELSRALGIDRSTGLRLLQDLEAGGYVIRDERTRRFEPSPAWVWGMAANTRAHVDAEHLIGPVLQGIRDDYDEATAFAVPANGAMVYVQHYSSGQEISLRERLGTVRAMNCSALGKAYLAGLTDDELDAELALINYQEGTERAAHGPLELRVRVLETRASGYAIDDGETFDGSACVAVPVMVHGVVVGAAGCQGPASRLSLARLDEIGRRLRRELERVGQPVSPAPAGGTGVSS
jgi:DNA-binding IclR family transcriptional regulator